MTQNSKIQIYFSGLNGLRFLAALAVVITHIELIKNALGIKNHWKNPLIFNLGGLGVYFFFVLSGFLITYLLLIEKETYKKINIKQFYIRRILRIWPLYYFIILIGFFVLPQFEIFNIPYLKNSFQENYNYNFILYLIILPNLAFSLFPAVPNIGQLWSIGVEEQFYIIWPWIISKTRNILKSLLILIIAFVSIKIVILILGGFFSHSTWYQPLKLFVAMSKFECMAIGGIGAYLQYTKAKYLLYLKQKTSVLICIVLSILLIYYTPDAIQDGIHIIYSILFLSIIMFVSNNHTPLLENKLLVYLGKISYGIYMYHFMIIPPILYLYKQNFSNSPNIFENIIIYLSVIITTILVSSISFKYFESYFINLKSRYSPIKSGK
jgi:peptidoglycan/LPS O-acetylase OafA/YrhL